MGPGGYYFLTVALLFVTENTFSWTRSGGKRVPGDKSYQSRSHFMSKEYAQWSRCVSQVRNKLPAPVIASKICNQCITCTALFHYHISIESQQDSHYFGITCHPACTYISLPVHDIAGSEEWLQVTQSCHHIVACCLHDHCILYILLHTGSTTGKSPYKLLQSMTFMDSWYRVVVQCTWTHINKLKRACTVLHNGRQASGWGVALGRQLLSTQLTPTGG